MVEREDEFSSMHMYPEDIFIVQMGSTMEYWHEHMLNQYFLYMKATK
jgi:hypothetical protein